MKKLKLKLDGKNMLTKDQMKKVTGGYELGDCAVFCDGGILYGSECPTVAQMDWACQYAYGDGPLSWPVCYCR